jgi:hypothetical protein
MADALVKIEFHAVEDERDRVSELFVPARQCVPLPPARTFYHSDGPSPVLRGYQKVDVVVLPPRWVWVVDV